MKALQSQKNDINFFSVVNEFSYYISNLHYHYQPYLPPFWYHVTLSSGFFCIILSHIYINHQSIPKLQDFHPAHLAVC